MENKRKTVEEIDKNFAAEKVSYEGMTTWHLPCSPFELRGLYHTEPGDYCRLPHEVARQCSESLQEMYVCPSGGRIRFRTDSERIIIKCAMPDMMPFPHMPFTGSHCFDLYADGHYVNTFRPDMSVTGEHVRRAVYFAAHEYDTLMRLPGRRMREVLIHFPLYSRVDNVWIALERGAAVEPPTPYTHKKPVVFYGSSITQGACASHPGNTYCNILSRRLDTDIVNLGFSSGCHGEDVMAEYLSTLDMSALVYDYDHNAGSAEELKRTHERAFRIIREKRPDLPVIMISAADRMFGIPERKEIIRQTYQNAVNAGDKNVYFIDGGAIYAPVGRDLCTVDHVHPNDVGFLMMTNALEPVLRRILAENAPCAV